MLNRAKSQRKKMLIELHVAYVPWLLPQRHKFCPFPFSNSDHPCHFDLQGREIKGQYCSPRSTYLEEKVNKLHICIPWSLFLLLFQECFFFLFYGKDCNFLKGDLEDWTMKMLNKRETQNLGISKKGWSKKVYILLFLKRNLAKNINENSSCFWYFSLFKRTKPSVKDISF